jgi:MGT family glycosyltransferase
VARFLFATLPVTGHVTPALPVAAALIARGNEVRWYTGRRFLNDVEATGATFVPMRTARDFNDLDVNGEFPERAGLKDLAQLKYDLKRVFIDAAPEQLADLREVLAEFPAEVVVSDTAVVGSLMLAELDGPPCAVFGITALPVSSRDTAPFGLGIGPSATYLGRLRNRGLGLLIGRGLFGDVNRHLNAVRRGVGLPPTVASVFDGALSPWLYLQPTVPAFEYPRSDLPPQVHFIGPLLPRRPASFHPPDWWGELSAGRPVIHVTQGTSATEPDQLLVPTLRALADDDVFVVATTGGRDPAGLGLDPLPANARVERFIPHYHLLPHVTAMVTNGGYGGVQVALANGVPLVVAGGSEDKPEVAARVAWSGVGINLKTRTPEPARIRAAVRAVLTDPRYRQRAAQLKADIAGYDAPTLAAQLLERLAETGTPQLRG